MPGSSNGTVKIDERLHQQLNDDLDKKVASYAFTQHYNKFLEDSPNKSELNQFGDFSGSHSQFGGSGSIERGMGDLDQNTGLSFHSRSGLPPMSPISSLSSHTDSLKKTRSEGGHRSSSLTRFTPMDARKVTSLGVHESESEWSPSKYHRPEVTPRISSRLNPQTKRNMPSKAYKDSAMLPKEFKFDQSVQNGDTNALPEGQSLAIPRNVPDISALLKSSSKAAHKAIEAVPREKGNEQTIEALNIVRRTVKELERANGLAEAKLNEAIQQIRDAKDSARSEQQRANLAERELKRLATHGHSSGQSSQTKLLEDRNRALHAALESTKEDLARLSVELNLAREEAASIQGECNSVTQRLAKSIEKVEGLTTENGALQEKVKRLTTENDSYQSQITTLKAQLSSAALSQDQEIHNIAQTGKAPKALAAKKTKKVGLEEISQSLYNESEVEWIAQEIEERRQEKAKKARKAAKSAGHRQQTVPRTKHEQGRVFSKAPAASESRPRSMPHVTKSKRKPELLRTVIEDTDTETFASNEEDENLDDYDSDDSLLWDGSDMENLAEDEPSRILYRRYPAIHTRGKKSTTAKANVKEVISKLSRHDIAKCTICSRKAAAKQSSAHRRGLSLDDGEETIRPSKPGGKALQAVLAELQDEFCHLKIVYHSQSDELVKLDPARRMRDRKKLMQDLRDTIQSMEVKADQIYSLWDVVEAVDQGKPLLYDEPNRPPSRLHGRREWINP